MRGSPVTAGYHPSDTTLKRQMVRHALALICVAVALCLAFFLAKWRPGFVTLSVFYPAVLLCSLLGTGPGILAVTLSSLAAWVVLLPPEWSLALGETSSVVDLVAFCACSAATLAIAEAYRRAHASRSAANQLFEAVQDISLEGLVVYNAVRNESNQVVDFVYR